jgi:hypothetical protein
MEMPLAQYPGMPSIRYSGIDMRMNMARQTEALQKKALPGEFATKMEKGASAAGKDQMAMAKAVPRAPI